MNMQVTSKLAKMGARLAAIGRRHSELDERIAAVKKRPQPSEIILRRLHREKARLQHEMQCYEGLLRTLARRLPT